MKTSRLFPMLAALSAAALSSSCASTTNQVTRYQGEPANAEQILTEGERFRNLYPSPKKYPLNCEQACYQPDPRLVCQPAGDACQVQWPELPAVLGWQLQWVGHASFRLQLPDGQLVLFDPVSADFDWPMNWLGSMVGSRRSAPHQPLLAAGQPVDAVFYSHAHYDHFNKADAAQFSARTALYLPFGMAKYLPEGGFNIHEMAWYSQHQQQQLTVHFVPAHHYTGRSLYELDGDTSLWGGWILEVAGEKLFFAGDTGYSPIFQGIRQKYGAMSVCLLPIGSYHGENYRNAHLAPEDALQVAEELGCKRMIPWGYGNHSWLMGDKSSHSALLRLLTMHQRTGAKVELQVFNEGEVIKI